jgi:RNA polymerase sigma-32 factor
MVSRPGKTTRQKRPSKKAASKASAKKPTPVNPDPSLDDDRDEEALEPEIVAGNDWDLEEAAKATRADAVEQVSVEEAAEPEDLAPFPAGGERSTALVPRDALGSYLAQIRQYPLLSREEEHELAVRYFEHGDLDAAYKLITSNLRLVVMIAREYQRAFHNLLDLVQEGNVGLLEAVRAFDPYRGVRLPSYAVWWIRAYVIRYVMNNFRLVKVGTTQAQRRLFFNLQKEKARLEAQGFKPTAKMIARNLGVKEREVIEMDMRMGASEVSVDAPVHAESDTPAVELMPEPDGATAEEAVANKEFYDLMRGKLADFGATLQGRDLEIFNRRLMADEPLTLQELGESWGVSRERVRQIEEALKKRLREYLVDQIRDVPQGF